MTAAHGSAGDDGRKASSEGSEHTPRSHAARTSRKQRKSENWLTAQILQVLEIKQRNQATITDTAVKQQQNGARRGEHNATTA